MFLFIQSNLPWQVSTGAGSEKCNVVDNAAYSTKLVFVSTDDKMESRYSAESHFNEIIL